MWYRSHKGEFESLETKDGKTIDFGRKSVGRLALKAALTPIAIPCLSMLYGMKGAEPPEHVKHEDMIDYFIESLIKFIGVLDDGRLYVESLEGRENDFRTINSISTHGRPAIREGRETGTEEEAEQNIRTRGPEYLHSGQNGYGQDQVNERDYTQEG